MYLNYLNNFVGFLWQLLCELSALHSNAVHETGVQTDVRVSPVSSLGKFLRYQLVVTFLTDFIVSPLYFTCYQLVVTFLTDVRVSPMSFLGKFSLELNECYFHWLTLNGASTQSSLTTVIFDTKYNTGIRYDRIEVHKIQYQNKKSQNYFKKYNFYLHLIYKTI